jgi:N-acetylmuramoyl-L-alanine amidase
MRIHIVKQGECLSSIAKKYGFASWRTIYDHPDNAELKRCRPNPDILYPGDEIRIPEKDPGTESVATGQSHTFKLTRQTTKLTVKIAEHRGAPIAGRPYSLKIGGGIIQGTLPDSGIIEHEIPNDLLEAELRIYFGGGAERDGCYHWIVKIAHLDPIDTVSGLQARLNNLGFYAGPVDGHEGPMTRTAIRQFQRAHGLRVDEIAGPKTQQKLKEVYGC